MVERGTGRWNKTNYLERKCLLCNDVEDEYHFVILCPKYYELRVEYLPKIYYFKPSMYKFLELVNSNDFKLLKKLGLFLHYAFKKYSVDEVFA